MFASYELQIILVFAGPSPVLYGGRIAPFVGRAPSMPVTYPCEDQLVSVVVIIVLPLYASSCCLSEEGAGVRMHSGLALLKIAGRPAVIVTPYAGLQDISRITHYMGRY